MEQPNSQDLVADLSSDFGVTDEVIPNDEWQAQDVIQLAPTTASISAYEVIFSKVQRLVSERANVMLVQRTGFGKTRIILELLTSNSFFLILVPTTALRDQMIRDIREKGFTCISGDQSSNQDPDYIVSQYHAGVWIFDNMPHLAPVVKAAVAAKKQTAVVVDEFHQLNQDKTYRYIFNRAWELGSQLSPLNGQMSWILLSAIVRCDEEAGLFQALNLPKFKNIIRGSIRMQGIQIEIHEESLPGPPAQLIFVKTRAEAETMASVLAGIRIWMMM